MGALSSGCRWVGVACAAVAAGWVAASAAFLTRSYMVNDDETLTAFLREGTLAPYLEPLLSQALGAAYAAAPRVPWFGLWQYAVYVAALALLARVLIEAPAGAPRSLRAVLGAGGALIFAAVGAQVFRITFTTAAITACGVALLGFAAEVLRRTEEAQGERPLRMLACGLVLAAGLATRTEALGAAAVAAGPLLLACGWRLRQAPPPPLRLALALLLAPSLALHGLGWFVVQSHEPEARRYLAFNAACNDLQLRAAFAGLQRRAPWVIREAGWDRRHYVRFQRWLYLDEGWYTTARLVALRDTGGAPRDLTVSEAAAHARGSAGHGYHLLGATLLAGAALGLSALGRRRAFLLGWGHLAVLAAVSAVFQRWLRFPARVALPMALLAGVAVWIAARADCDCGAWARAGTVLRGRPLRAAAAVMAVMAALAWLGPALRSTLPPAPEATSACADFERRLVARNPALVVVHAQAACRRDPLRAQPRPYPHLSLDWDIFSVPFYRGLARIGIRRGAELVPRLVGDDRIYILAERRFLRALDGMLADDAPGARLDVVDTSGPGLGDLVLSTVRDPLPPGAPRADPTETERIRLAASVQAR